MATIDNNIVDSIDIEPRHLEMVHNILASHIPHKTVWGYGSRIKWTATERSDLDIVVFDASDRELGILKDCFDESDIPFVVQIASWEDIPADFQENIAEKYYVLQDERSWRLCRLGDVVEVKYGKEHKSLGDGQYPCFGSGGLMRAVDKFLYDDESILIPRKRTLNNIMYQNKSFWTVDTMFWTKINKEKAHPKFLFFQLIPIDYTTLNVGSAVPSLTVPVINEIQIKLPPLPEQRAIAEVLSSLDDKIDLLHRQNSTLEAMAEALFRHYFIDNADDSWEEGKLGDFVNVVDNRGKTPPYQREITLYPVIEVNALGQENRLIDYSVIRKYVTQETFEKWFRDTPKKYDTLISTVGSIGAISMFLINKGNIAQNVIALQPKAISPLYIYQILQHKKEKILQLDIGGVQPSIKVPHLLSIIIPIPSLEVQKKFDIQITNLIRKLENNYQQILTLEKLRDTLLPKLVSGDIRVEYEEI